MPVLILKQEYRTKAFYNLNISHINILMPFPDFVIDAEIDIVLHHAAAHLYENRIF